MIRPDFYIPDLEEQAIKFTRACVLCLQHKSAQGKKVPLGQLPLPPAKSQKRMLDFVPGLPPTNKEDLYLSIIDPFSGFRLAIPCSSTITAEKTIQIVERHIIQPFGIPHMLLSDRGPNLLVSKAFGEFLKFYGIKKHLSVLNSAKSHGLVESSNRRISEVLKILSEQHDVPWTKLLHYSTLVLNCRPYSRLGGMTPYEIMFGKKGVNIKSRLQMRTADSSITESLALFRKFDS
jgi:hypothetical protein